MVTALALLDTVDPDAFAQARASIALPGATPPVKAPDESSAPAAMEAMSRAQQERFNEELETLKQRTTAQQTLIGALTTLTGLYAAILSLTAYFRLEQIKGDVSEAIKNTKEDFKEAREEFNRKFDVYDKRVEDFIAEVRKDVPAVHGIGRRLELLLAQLRDRLPTDDWSEPKTYRNMSADQKEQVLVDEMVINSFEIFSTDNNLQTRRTISRLYVSIGQFYFGKALSLRQQAREATDAAEALRDEADAEEALRRADIYLEKATSADENDPVAWRVKGVLRIHDALPKKDSEPVIYRQLISHAIAYIDRSLEKHSEEPGACFAKAWLFVHTQTPPDFTSAIRKLSVIIDGRDQLSSFSRRKFLAFFYLNRANYLALRSRSITQPEEEAQVFENIVSDIKAGAEVAQEAGRGEQYKTELRKELGLNGDLKFVYEDAKSKMEIDRLFSTT